MERILGESTMATWLLRGAHLSAFYHRQAKTPGPPGRNHMILRAAPAVFCPGAANCQGVPLLRPTAAVGRQSEQRLPPYPWGCTSRPGGKEGPRSQVKTPAGDRPHQKDLLAAVGGDLRAYIAMYRRAQAGNDAVKRLKTIAAGLSQSGTLS